MKAIAVIILIHILACSFAEAQQVPGLTSERLTEQVLKEQPQVSDATTSKTNENIVATESANQKKLDDCQDLLPQMENDYKEIERKLRTLDVGSQESQDTYLTSFNQMTEFLFQLTEARELETQNISASRDQLRDSLNQFNQNKNAETSKSLQDNYLNLTVRLYSAMMDSQKTLGTLKTQLSQIEVTRSQYESSQKEFESLDHQKLALEAKLISLKIKCQPTKRYY